MKLSELIPNHADVIALEPEEFAGVLIQHLRDLARDNRGMLHLGNYTNVATFDGYENYSLEDLQNAVVEAWMWLEAEGLLVPSAGSNGTNGWRRLSRRGQRVATDAGGVDAYRRAAQLPRKLLHPSIAQKVAALFLRGDYDVAVFQAFKQVEVAVRAAGGFGPGQIGVDLMNLAFSPGKGPLADKGAVHAEQLARMNLFAGAIGSFKNPHSHRHVDSEAEETIELLMFASHLLRIVDGIAPTGD